MLPDEEQFIRDSKIIEQRKIEAAHLGLLSVEASSEKGGDKRTPAGLPLTKPA